MYHEKKISLIIPAGRPERREAMRSLIESLKDGTLPPDEVIVVENISPNSRARNIGVERSTGEILVLADDDAQIPQVDTLEKVVETLLSDDNIGICGASQDIPPDANRFQRAYRRQFARTHFPVVSETVESDMATTLFCAIRRCDIEAVGGFDESLIAGVDVMLRHKIRQLGKRIVVAPGTIAYHPLPSGWRELFRRVAWYGSARAILAQKPDYPFAGLRLHSGFAALGYLAAQWLLFPTRFFIGGPSGRKFGFWPLRAVAHIVNSTAYALSVISRKFEP